VIVVWHVKLANRALRDLDHIYAHLEAASSAQAVQWFARLEQAIFSLENQPQRGTRVPEDAGLRQLLHGRKPYVYRVIYEVNEAAATVHVLHIRGPRRDRIKR
jgi:plasmid stabilization system protein ParE